MATTSDDLRPVASAEDFRADVLASDVGGPAIPAAAVTDRADTVPTTAHAAPPRRTPRTSWPLMLAIAGWPVWWGIGFSQLVFILAAIPLGLTLSRRRPLVFPPGFVLWALFLVLVVVSAIALDAEAVGAAAPSGFGRYFAYGLRLGNYVAVTVVLLYVVNATEEELPRRSVFNWFGVLGTSAVGLGLLSLVFPDLQWTSPVAQLLPDAISDTAINRLAQVQGVLGDPTPRPAAPYAYSNAWGNSTALLLVLMMVTFWVLGSSRRRLFLVLLLVAAVPPVIYSLNRAMWLGLILAAVVVALRLAVRGHTGPVLVLGGVAATAGLAVALSPLGGVIAERLETPHSNSIRESLASAAFDLAKQSPVIGFGSTRDTLGSEASIAVGPTPDCPRCGGRVIGSTGQFTLLLVAQGFLGVVLYSSYFVVTLWAFRTDHSPLGVAAWVVVLVELFFGFFYTALTMPLAITFVCIGLLSRNARVRAGDPG